MTRLVVVALIIAVLSSTSLATRPARASALHDFDAATLASYVALRFSSGVPANVIAKILAGEGFSPADVALVSSSASPSPGRPSSDVSQPGITTTQMSRDDLACPASDTTPCELDTEPEPDIAVNPDATGNLVGVFQMGRFPDGGAVDVGFATSFDGGRTWPYRGAAPGLTVGVSSRPSAGPGAPFARASDPVIAYDRKHKNVYLNWIAVSDRGCALYCDTAVGVNISNNQGQTFGPPVVLHEDDQGMDGSNFVFNDKNWIVTDNTPTSPYFGRTYAVWDQVGCLESTCTATQEPVVLRYSDDGGKTWSQLIFAVNEQPGPAHSSVGVQPLTLPNGHVVIVYADVQAGVYTYSGLLKAIRSTNGGRTWESPVTIAPLDAVPEETAPIRAPNVPSAAVSGGAIYVAYHGAAGAKNDIFLVSSANEGAGWTAPLDVTPTEPTLDHFTAALAVQGSMLHLLYRTRTAGSNIETDPRVDAVYRAVSSAGATLAGPTVLATSDLHYAAFSTVASQMLRFLGDYHGIAASPISVHPIWSQAFNDVPDNATHTHERAFGARIQ